MVNAITSVKFGIWNVRVVTAGCVEVASHYAGRG